MVAHTGQQIQDIAARRQITQASVLAVGCSHCGVGGQSPAAAFAIGFGHMDDFCRDTHIQFVTKDKKAEPTRVSYRHRVPGPNDPD